MTLLRCITAVAFGAASLACVAADVAEPTTCDCKDAKCTEVDGIHLASAQRAIVRRLLIAKGATLLPAREPGSTLDTFRANASAPYSEVHALFFEDRLAGMTYVYGEAAKLGVDDLGKLDAIFGVPTSAKGSFGDAETSLRGWLSSDGVRVEMWRLAGERGATARYTVVAVAGELEAYVAREGRPLPVGEETSPANGGAPKDEITVSTQQGRLAMRARSPIRNGASELAFDICGGNDDFDDSVFRDFPDSLLPYVVFHPGNVVDVKLGVSEGESGTIYQFDRVAPGAETLARPAGDCSDRLRARWSPTRSKLCVHAVQTNQPARAVVERVVATTGVVVDGIDTLPDKRVTFIGLDLTVEQLLGLIVDVSEVPIEKIDETHYAFKPVSR